MSRIHFSHSSIDNAPAIALCDWRVGEGWDGPFLDLDTEAGFAATERWEHALAEAARQVVLFLISTGPRMCTNQVHACGLNKRLPLTSLGGTTIAF